MPHFVERVRSPTVKQAISPAAAARPQPRRTGPPRSAMWHLLQLKAAQAAAPAPAASAQSRSGLPARLKAGVETLSGIAMDDVRVHRNSAEPGKLGALAYAQGSDIHLGPGQERHLPHEAWHVVQQKQGRVQATTQMKAMAVNEDGGLEREADMMGGRALAAGAESPLPTFDAHPGSASSVNIVQKMSVGGTAKTARASNATRAKHVVATNSQEAAAQANFGSTTFVTSAASITDPVDANNHDFTPSTTTTPFSFQSNVTVSRYVKTGRRRDGDWEAGKPVTRDINAQSTNCDIGVLKSSADGVTVTHFKTA